MYTCGEIEKLLDIYTDGELDERRRPGVESHLQVCPRCSRLARLRESEARLIRSSDPVPALSAGFTGLVMSNLGRTGRPRYRGDWFFPLNRVIARPWMAPALAGLLLLVTVSWAASGRLAAINPKLAANYGQQDASQPVPAAPETPAPGDNDQVLNDSAAPGIPPETYSEVEPGHAQPSADSNNNESQALKNAADAEKDRVALTLPQATSWGESRGVGAAGPDTGGAPAGRAMELRAMSLPLQQVSYDELEQQGYAVFEPGYLPPGYSLQPYAVQPQDQGESGRFPAVTPAGLGSLSLAYRNDQAGETIALEIRPLDEPAAPPAPEPVKEPEAAGEPDPDEQQAELPLPEPLPDGVNQIAWTAQKNGGDFMLKLIGSVPVEELDKVRASIK